MAPTYPPHYDDNFGEWQIESQDDVEFYNNTQRTNVRKKCSGCGNWVKIQPHYSYCNSCADKRERGLDCE